MDSQFNSQGESPTLPGLCSRKTGVMNTAVRIATRRSSLRGREGQDERESLRPAALCGRRLTSGTAGSPLRRRFARRVGVRGGPRWCRQIARMTSYRTRRATRKGGRARGRGSPGGNSHSLTRRCSSRQCRCSPSAPGSTAAACRHSARPRGAWSSPRRSRGARPRGRCAPGGRTGTRR